MNEIPYVKMFSMFYVLTHMQNIRYVMNKANRLDGIKRAALFRFSIIFRQTLITSNCSQWASGNWDLLQLHLSVFLDSCLANHLSSFLGDNLFFAGLQQKIQTSLEKG